jgi:hypothetical protein
MAASAFEVTMRLRRASNIERALEPEQQHPGSRPGKHPTMIDFIPHPPSSLEKRDHQRATLTNGLRQGPFAIHSTWLRKDS